MKIFISYQSTDRAIVQELVSDLEGTGYEVWYDQVLKGGQKWWNNVLENIRESDVVLAALTPQWLQSYPCQLEYNYAHSLGKNIIPITLVDEINIKLLPVILQERQILDYLKRDKEDFKNLINALRKLPSPLPLPDPLPVAPPLPVSPLAVLKEKIDGSQMSYEEQVLLVDQLKGFLSNQEYANDARNLLTRLGQHPTLYASVFQEIQRLLSTSTDPVEEKVKVPKETPRAKTATPEPKTFGVQFKDNEKYVGDINVWHTRSMGLPDIPGRLIATNLRLIFQPSRGGEGKALEIKLNDISNIEKKTKYLMWAVVEIKTSSGRSYDFHVQTGVFGTGTDDGQEAIIALIESAK
jgi:hypothetical protein